MSEEITITLPDGSCRVIPAGGTAGDLAAALDPALAGAAVIAEVNGVERDLGWPLAGGDRVAIVTGGSERGLHTIRHSTAHVLAQAVLDLFPGATFGIGPPVEHGFHYDFELPGGAAFTPDDLDRLDARMREIIAAAQPFVRAEIPIERARTLFRDHRYKLEIINGQAEDPMSATEAGLVSTYENPPRFVDLCRGPHVPDTSRLGHFKLMRVAGAYWRGDEKNPVLQRIYGTAWATARQLDEHLERLEEAARRDHRRLGAELDLFSFPDEIGSGLAVFHPRGGLVRRLVEDHSRARHEAAGYEFVYTPHITRAELFEASGDLDRYGDGMYPPMELDGGTDYYLRPMTCPFHVLIYRSRLRSYRELPLRLFEFGTVYRYEKSGVVQGLTRARGFSQDHSHVFTTREGLAEELRSLLVFMLDVLRDYGLEDFHLELATRPPGTPVGTDGEWEEATGALRSAAESMDLDLVPDEGGSGLLGPRLSVHMRDAIGRTWQLSTIQLDLHHPQRFELEYVGADGDRHRPVMIHRALFGSVERFFAILVEHFAGAFPVWLAPVQVRVLPVRHDHDVFAHRLADRLRGEGFRVDAADAAEPLGHRIHRARSEKLPYVLVVGDDDVRHGTVGVNPRGGQVERDVAVGAFIERLRVDLAGHLANPV